MRDTIRRDCAIGPRQHIDCSYYVFLMAKPGVTLHRLELFLAVREPGGVAKAARARRISQPAVSEHLRGLERYFGVTLLERSGRGVRPTAGARSLAPFARPARGPIVFARRGGRLSPGPSRIPRAAGPLPRPASSHHPHAPDRELPDHRALGDRGRGGPGGDRGGPAIAATDGNPVG